MRAQAKWRDPVLGTAKEVELRQGRMRYFEAGSGATIVFVHGGFVNANVWRKVFPRLSRDFHCVALDLPFASHELPMPRAELDSLRGCAELVASAIEALGLDDVTLVGQDFGGAVCQTVVVERPERIGRLVLCSCDYRNNFPPRRFSYLRLFPYLGRLYPLLAAPFRLRAVNRSSIGFGALTRHDVDRAVIDSWVLPGFKDRRVRADFRFVKANFDKRALNETADRLHTFDRPALIAWSADDQVFPLEHGERLARELPNARLEPIEDSWSMSMEEQPERLSELIAGFVREPRGTETVSA